MVCIDRTSREELLRARLVHAELRRDVVRVQVSAVADASDRRREVLAAVVVEDGLAKPATWASR